VPTVLHLDVEPHAELLYIELTPVNAEGVPYLARLIRCETLLRRHPPLLLTM
jgi:hypothetical protein